MTNSHAQAYNRQFKWVLDQPRVVLWTIFLDEVSEEGCSQVCTLTGVRVVAFSPDGKLVVTGSKSRGGYDSEKDKLVHLWNAATGAKVHGGPRGGGCFL